MLRWRCGSERLTPRGDGPRQFPESLRPDAVQLTDLPLRDGRQLIQSLVSRRERHLPGRVADLPWDAVPGGLDRPKRPRHISLCRAPSVPRCDRLMPSRRIGTFGFPVAFFHRQYISEWRGYPPGGGSGTTMGVTDDGRSV
ncbi:MAG: hypothetical protein AVDCRST_MAG33-2942 [uncultured Thermomicrobiales bacterium]|uniref:Uncharacterized protein n=1 Tax=uncultured Thermomicrobiales bacterium TaxID=1645740 RepID=A0A6J4VE08_9BACT|nr:MAG: hypothetical protein AVDCRST_MAG33-2942 [uncultured Thermomicrobiales bacterium]